VQSGTDNALKRMEDWEDRDTAEYQQLAATAPSDADREAIAAAQADEERHSRLLFNPAPARSDEPQALLDVILRRERWHTRSGGWIGQAIYGANDGLGAVFGIGAAKTVVTGRSPWRSGLEMTVVGVGEAAITYLLGLAFGQVIS